MSTSLMSNVDNFSIDLKIIFIINTHQAGVLGWVTEVFLCTLYRKLNKLLRPTNSIN